MSVKLTLASLEARREADDDGAEVHHAAVFPAIRRAMNVIAANAPDEWPDGNEHLPSSMSLVFLQRAKLRVSIERGAGRVGRTRCRSLGQRHIYNGRENRDAVDLSIVRKYE